MIELKDITPELIQNAEGAELDRIAFVLKLAASGYVIFDDVEQKLVYQGHLKEFRPATAIKQAMEIFYRQKPGTVAHITMYVGATPEDNMNAAEVNHIAEYETHLARSEISLACALTRACCLAALARIRSGE